MPKSTSYHRGKLSYNSDSSNLRIGFKYVRFLTKKLMIFLLDSGCVFFTQRLKDENAKGESLYKLPESGKSFWEVERNFHFPKVSKLLAEAWLNVFTHE